MEGQTNDVVAVNKKRGWWLTTWLILMLVASIFTVINYILLNKTISSIYPSIPVTIWYIYGLAGIANIIFVVFLFKWRKWPFYAFCGMAIIALCLNLLIGLRGLSVATGLLGPLILYFSMKSRWSLFT